ncbi:MAG: dephospho-CoA kinase [Fimbriimonadia bacterium]
MLQRTNSGAASRSRSGAVVSRPPGPLHVAITGGACAGKSTVLSYFAELGVPTFSADEVARELTRPGTSLAKAVAEAVGPGATLPDGALNRRFIARRIFEDDSLRRKVEALLHRPIMARLGDLSAQTPGDVHCFEIPLLIEAGLQGEFHRVILCRCGRREQMRRLVARWEGDERLARRILSAQISDAERRPHAHFVVMTNRPPEKVRKRVEAILANLRRTSRVHA